MQKGNEELSRAAESNPHIKNGTFQQLIDHHNPSLGTFSQRFFWSDEFYGGKGSPVSLLLSFNSLNV